MKLLFTLAFVLVICFQGLKAQDIGSQSSGSASADKPKIPLKERFYFGGNLGAQFGNYTVISVAPLAGFKLTERWSVGLQPSYTYVDIKYPTYNFSDNIYGGSVFTRYFFFRGFFAHTEFEALNGNWAGSGERFNVNSLFVGGGYLYKFTDNAGLGISAMFNLLPSIYNPYQNPIINAGFTYGL